MRDLLTARTVLLPLMALVLGVISAIAIRRENE